MHCVFRIAAVAFASFQLVASVSAQEQWTVTGQEVSELAAVDLMMQDIMQGHDIRGASVAIAKNGRLVYARGFTWDQVEVEPVQPTTLFRIGSAGKAITSIAVHQLIEDGLLSYDTRVASRLGIEPPPGRTVDPWYDLVTVDHLLTHTSGMYAHDSQTIDDQVVDLLGIEPPPTREEVLSVILGVPFMFEPETSWGYNNYGYVMLGMMVEQAIGLAFPEYVFDNILRPVGVTRARMAHSIQSELAPTETSYDCVGGDDPYGVLMEAFFAAGPMVMSAPDLARLYTALFDHPDASGLLDDQTIDDMLSMPFPVGEAIGYGRGWVNEDFFINAGRTLGWLIDAGDDYTVWGHPGGGNGVHTVAVRRSDGTVFVLFTNKDPVVYDFDLPEITSWPDHDLWESVGILDEPAGSAPTEAWIPVVTHGDGAAGSVWRTDLAMLNRSLLGSQIRLRAYRDDQWLDHELLVQPGQSILMPDVVSALGATGSLPLRIFASEPVTVSSRTYAQESSGTFGQPIPASCVNCGLQSGDQVVLMQLREDPTARTNIGILNGFKRDAEVEITLHDGDGTLISTFTETVPAESTLQLNRPLTTRGGRTDVASAYATVNLHFGKYVFVYGSLVDNGSNDPTTLPAKRATGATKAWVAAAAHAEGAYGSEWRTDLCLLNHSGATTTVEILFRGQDELSQQLALADGQQLLLEDVVALLGAAGVGSIEVTAAQPILVHSRTYCWSSEGTFGQALDGVTEGAAAGDRLWLVGLHQNEAFRTNIGLLNTGSGSATVRLELFEGSGQLLAARAYTLTPGQRIQVQEPFAAIAGRQDVVGGYASVVAQIGSGVVTYASVIDNNTNDPTTIVPQR